MPTYTYKCSKCGKTHETVQKVSEHTQTDPCFCGGMAKSIIVGSHAQPFETYYDRFQNVEFKSKKQFERYCKEKNLYKPTQQEINRHREEFQTSGPKAYRKRRIYV